MAQAPIIRLGIVGLGMAGSGILPALARHPGMVLGGAATRGGERRAQFTRDFGVPAYETIDELCASGAVDAVYIATPTQFHTEHVLTAARYGLHVIVEKPMAIRLQDATRMVEAVDAAGVTLVVGHSHSFEPPIRTMRDLIVGGSLGRVRFIQNWYFNDWLYRPRTPDELNTAMGGGVTFRQGAHQFDIIRLLGGGLLRSVRAATGIWDPARPTEGSHLVFMEFEDGAAATATYSGYDHFWTTEMTGGIGEWGDWAVRPTYAGSRRRIEAARVAGDETRLKGTAGYGAEVNPLSQATVHQPFFGFTLVSCEHGDLRQSPDGVIIYGDYEQTEVSLAKAETGRDAVLRELYNAVHAGFPPVHSARWGRATLEVSLAALESARERREVYLRYQVPVDA